MKVLSFEETVSLRGGGGGEETPFWAEAIVFFEPLNTIVTIVLRLQEIVHRPSDSEGYSYIQTIS